MTKFPMAVLCLMSLAPDAGARTGSAVGNLTGFHPIFLPAFT